jgi:hypothetical protein
MQTAMDTWWTTAARSVCADFYRHAYGIPLCAWNKTSAALHGDRPINGLNQPVPPRPPRPPPRRPPPRPLPTGSRALLAVLPPLPPLPPLPLRSPCTSSPPATELAHASTSAPPVLPVDSAGGLQPAQARRRGRSLFAAFSDAGSASPAAFQQEMLEALSCAPTEVLLAAAGAVHAASLQRGVLLTPSDQLARRGVSAVSHNTMPCVCAECEEPGTWRHDQDVLALICCRTCITASHQSFACSRMEPWQMQVDGWQCSSCQADDFFVRGCLE